MISAILRAQLLSMRGMGIGRTAGFWVGLIPNLLFYAFISGMGLLGQMYLSKENDIAELIPLLSVALLIVCAYWQIAPVITNSMGASLDLKKLVTYPIEPSKLFQVEVLLRFFTVGEMLVAILFVMIGITRNPFFGGVAALPRIVLAALALIAFNLFLAAGVRSLVEALFRQKRMREYGMFLFVAIAIAPTFVLALHIPWARFQQFFPVGPWSPWGAAANLFVGRGVVPAMSVLAISIVLAYRFGRWQFFRALRSDGYGSSVQAARPDSRIATLIAALITFPSHLFTDPLAAMIEKDLRALFRCSAFRLSFFIGISFGILPVLPQLFSGMNDPHPSFLIQHLLTWQCGYSLLLIGYYTFWNAFGFDRAAAQFYFAAPVSFRTTLIGKNLTAATVQGLQILLTLFLFTFLPIHFAPVQYLEAVLVTATACIYLFAAGNLLSIRLPVALQPDKMNQGGAKRSASALSMVLVPIGFAPIGIAFWGLAVFHSYAIFFGLLTIAASIGAIFYWIALDSAVTMAGIRREEMISILSRSEGPLSIR